MCAVDAVGSRTVQTTRCHPKASGSFRASTIDSLEITKASIGTFSFAETVSVSTERNPQPALSR